MNIKNQDTFLYTVYEITKKSGYYGNQNINIMLPTSCKLFTEILKNQDLEIIITLTDKEIHVAIVNKNQIVIDEEITYSKDELVNTIVMLLFRKKWCNYLTVNFIKIDNNKWKLTLYNEYLYLNKDQMKLLSDKILEMIKND